MCLQTSGLVEALVRKPIDMNALAECIRAVARSPMRFARVAWAGPPTCSADKGRGPPHSRRLTVWANAYSAGELDPLRRARPATIRSW